MSRITYEQVKEDVESKGWTLISTGYKNLDTDLEVICQDGHKIFKPYKYLRKGCVCPVCEQNKKAAEESISLPKTKAYRILALDQATMITGWSLWDGEQLVGYGKYSPNGGQDSIDRIVQIKNWLISMIQNNKPDMVILEDIQLQDFHSNNTKDAKFDNVGIITFKVLAKLQGVLECALQEFKTTYKVIFSTTWRKGIGVRGRSRADKKKSAQLIVKNTFDINVSEDEADAICLGKYAASIYGKEVRMVSW